MNVAALNASITRPEAAEAHLLYKRHKSENHYDQLDMEIERIYRAIAKGNVVISVQQAIYNAGLDSLGRPKLAICRAHRLQCRCRRLREKLELSGVNEAHPWKKYKSDTLEIAWPGMTVSHDYDLEAEVPRVPPQHRPGRTNLQNYHILWEADWKDIPRDPYLLRRIGADAWLVLAEWNLTEVEVSVLRAHKTAKQ